MAEEGDKHAARMLELVGNPTGFLSAIQIGITLAGFLGSAFAADNFADRLVRWIVDDLHYTAIPESSAKYAFRHSDHHHPFIFHAGIR